MIKIAGILTIVKLGYFFILFLRGYPDLIIQVTNPSTLNFLFHWVVHVSCPKSRIWMVNQIDSINFFLKLVFSWYHNLILCLIENYNSWFFLDFFYIMLSCHHDLLKMLNGLTWVAWVIFSILFLIRIFINFIIQYWVRQRWLEIDLHIFFFLLYMTLF